MKYFVSVLLIIAISLSFFTDLDTKAMELHNEAFERAMISFGLAKGLNAVISLIQGTQLSFTPIGVGLNFSIGEILDPFNDIVERFSWIMLASSVSLGIQKLLLLISSKAAMQVALITSGVLSIIFILSKSYQARVFAIIMYKFLIITLILRFSAIVFVFSSHLFYNSILDNDFQRSNEVLLKTQRELEAVQSKNDRLLKKSEKSSWYGFNAKADTNLFETLKKLSTNIDEASRNIIELITIFVVQDMLMPLLFLWFFIFSIKVTIKADLKKLLLYFNRLDSTR